MPMASRESTMLSSVLLGLIREYFLSFVDRYKQLTCSQPLGQQWYTFHWTRWNHSRPIVGSRSSCLHGRQSPDMPNFFCMFGPNSSPSLDL